MLNVECNSLSNTVCQHRDCSLFACVIKSCLLRISALEEAYSAYIAKLLLVISVFLYFALIKQCAMRDSRVYLIVANRENIAMQDRSAKLCK